MILHFLFLLTLLQGENALIEGVVKDSATDVPLYGVRVGLISGENSPDGSMPFQTITDDTGRFRISARAGNYELVAQRDGYFGQPVNGVVADSSSRHLVLVPRQQMSNITMSLQPGGALSGRFVDQFGRPNTRLTVAALRVIYNQGRREYRQVRTADTNDRGEFRLYWMPPGEYIVSGSPRTVFTTAIQPVAQRSAVRTFFPGTTDISKAAPVTVQSGSDTTGMNFGMETAQGVTIAGRIINPYLKPPPGPAPGQATSSFVAPPSVYLVARGNALNESQSQFGNGATAAEQREGLFRFSGVAPGVYDVYVVANDGGPTLTASFGGVASLEVGSVDAAVSVTVVPPVELKGRVIINGAGPRVELTTVRLRPLDNVPGVAGATTPPPAMIAPTGEFVFPKIVMPITYGLDFDVPDGLFLADIRQGQQSIYKSAAIVLNGTAPEPVQIILARNPGTVRGRIEKTTPDPAVALVPEPSLRSNPMLYRVARPGDDGTFVLKNIPPGNYKLFAWDGVLSTAWMNADFIKTFESRGVPVKIEQKEMQLDSPLSILK
jgi:hypothetical protein